MTATMESWKAVGMANIRMELLLPPGRDPLKSSRIIFYPEDLLNMGSAGFSPEFSLLVNIKTLFVIYLFKTTISVSFATIHHTFIVCRTLGIPARPVSNLVSAHDANGTLTIDRYYDARNSNINHFCISI